MTRKKTTTKVPFCNPFSQQLNQSYFENLKDPIVEVSIFWFQMRKHQKRSFIVFKNVAKSALRNFADDLLVSCLPTTPILSKTFRPQPFQKMFWFCHFWIIMRHFQMHCLLMAHNKFLSFRNLTPFFYFCKRRLFLRKVAQGFEIILLLLQILQYDRR